MALHRKHPLNDLRNEELKEARDLHRKLVFFFIRPGNEEEEKEQDSLVKSTTLPELLETIPDRLLYATYGMAQSYGDSGVSLEVFNRLISVVDREIEKRAQQEVFDRTKAENDRAFKYMWIATSLAIGLSLFQACLQLYDLLGC